MGRSHGNPDSLETLQFSRSLFAKSHLEKLFHKIIPHTSEAVSALPFWSSMLRSTASCTARCTASFAQPMCVRPALEPGVREDRCSQLRRRSHACLSFGDVNPRGIEDAAYVHREQ